MQRIFVGDVQGCGDELDELVARARDAFGDEFSLWFVGDLINRGPENRRVLELVRRFVDDGRSEVVLGNHEIFAIAAGLGVVDLRPDDTLGPLLAAPDAGDWIDWLRMRPLVLTDRIGDQPFAMVHAAVPPDWELEQLVGQTAPLSRRLAGPRDEAAAFLGSEVVRGGPRDLLGRMTRCRSVLPDGDWSSEEPGGLTQPWHRVWASRGHDYGIVYGHWAIQGLHVARGLRGLDTGCVHHGRGKDGFLTAWLPEERPRATAGRPFDLPDDRFWQIRAHRRYYDPGQSG